MKKWNNCEDGDFEATKINTKHKEVGKYKHLLLGISEPIDPKKQPNHGRGKSHVYTRVYHHYIFMTQEASIRRIPAYTLVYSPMPKPSQSATTSVTYGTPKRLQKLFLFFIYAPHSPSYAVLSLLLENYICSSRESLSECDQAAVESRHRHQP